MHVFLPSNISNFVSAATGEQIGELQDYANLTNKIVTMVKKKKHAKGQKHVLITSISV